MTSPLPPSGLNDNLYYQIMDGEQWITHGAYIPQLGNIVATPKLKLKPKPKGKEKKHNLTIKKLFPDSEMDFYPPEQLIGIEIETEGKNLFDAPLLWWHAKGDGSLRPYEGHEPKEYVLREPITPPEVIEALDYLNDRMAIKSELHLSHRCSVHLHMNCQHLLLKQVLTIMCLYFVFEELLVEWCGEERVSNIFCLRGVDAQHYINVIENCIKTDTYGMLKDDSVRYSSCNPASLSKFGSLEFRALRGTTEKDVITTWMGILLALREAALSFDDPTDIITAFESMSLKEFVVFALGDYAKIFAKHKNLKETIWRGIRLIRELVYCSKWSPPLPKPRTCKKGNKK